jgi:hypothetical protein
LVRELEITPQSSDTVERELIRPYLGASQVLLANTKVEITFQVELAGSGTAGTAPRYGAILKACGFSETVSASTSVTYAPVSANPSSATIYYNVDGVLHKITGCRGTFKLSGEVGEIPYIEFEMTGIYNAPTDTALATAVYTNQATPLVFKNGNTSSFELFSYAGCLQSIELEVGNEILYRELVGCTKQTLITDRKVTGTVMIEAVSLATKNYFATALSDATLGNLQFTHGVTAGNIVTVSSSTIDLGDVSYDDADGVQMLSIPVVAIPSSAGNDEVSLIFT